MRPTLYILFIAALCCCSCANDSQGSHIPQNRAALLHEVFGKKIPQQHGWVNDWADIFTDEEEARLSKLITDNEAATTIEIVIVTYPADMATKDNLDSLTTALGSAWAIGKKHKDNGIIIGISPSNRNIRISNGYGIEYRMTDEETKIIIDICFVPSFKAEQYYGGTAKGINAIIAHLATH